MNRKAMPRHVLCVSNEGYPVSLIVRRVYTVMPDEDGEPRGLVRVIDESGEDYLFPSDLFVAITLPEAALRSIQDEPAPTPHGKAEATRRR